MPVAAAATTVIDAGAGAPVVLIPGIQGRWEWTKPTVEALARRCRVLTFSLAGDPGTAGGGELPDGFETLIAQVDAALDRAGLERAAICGVSFGGWVALHYAAVRPDRVTALVLSSAPSPRWRPTTLVRLYLSAPRLFVPLFVAGSIGRLAPEIVATFDTWRARVAFAVRHAWRVLRAPLSPTRMRRRVEAARQVDFVEDCRRVRAPVLLVAGEAELDRVVSVPGTREYLDAIPGSRWVTLERTGHIGLVTRPEIFAQVVSDFVQARTAARPATEERHSA